MKKSTGGPGVTEEPAPAPDAKAPKPRFLDKKGEGIRARDKADDFWISSNGACHISGNKGRGIYTFLLGSSRRHDTTCKFHGDWPVNNQVGWTYKEECCEFYMLFALEPTGNRYEIKYSFDGDGFDHYAWAE